MSLLKELRILSAAAGYKHCAPGGAPKPKRLVAAEGDDNPPLLMYKGKAISRKSFDLCPTHSPLSINPILFAIAKSHRIPLAPTSPSTENTKATAHYSTQIHALI